MSNFGKLTYESLANILSLPAMDRTLIRQGSLAILVNPFLH